jgi:hypothetical protein
MADDAAKIRKLRKRIATNESKIRGLTVKVERAKAEGDAKKETEHITHMLRVRGQIIRDQAEIRRLGGVL